MYSIVISKYFKSQIKKYLKKYGFFLEELIVCLETFDPNQHVHLGEGAYKVRFANSNLKKGKRNSFRLIILLLKTEDIITPIVLYYKGDQEVITRREIKYHVERVKTEILSFYE